MLQLYRQHPSTTYIRHSLHINHLLQLNSVEAGVVLVLLVLEVLELRAIEHNPSLLPGTIVLTAAEGE